MLSRLTSLAPVLLLLGVAPGALAQGISQQQVDTLARDVARVEGVRAVKNLQRSYAQYAQFALAEPMAALFTDDAELIWGDDSARGHQAIAAWLMRRMGGQLRPGALHSELIEDPLVNLSADGQSAKARWMGLTLAGDGAGATRIEGGIYENEYVLDGGVWKIARVHFSPQYEGSYEGGWTNIGNAELPRIPFHFTIDETGIPIPPAQGIAPASDATMAILEQRIAALNAEDAVRNLQNAYGYYVDRRMWDDVVDLFAADGVVEIAGTGRFAGAGGVRQAMETMGPQGLEQGVFNEYPIFDTIVTVGPDGREAFASGLALGMIGRGEAAGWEFQLFRNRFVLDEGLWKIAEMRLYPLVKADYATGWGRGGTAHLPAGMLPAFQAPHPVTGQAVTYSGAETAQAMAAPRASAERTDDAEPDAARLADAERRLRRSWAFDGVENVSSAYGYYLDDFQWVALASIFAENGNKQSPFAGYYLGRDRIRAAATTMWGEPPATRPGISYHWRNQPVIHVSHDGRSANLRTRLFQPRTSMRRSGGERATGPLATTGFNSGMYPNDQAVLEDGIWRLWSLTIDEHYMTSDDWRGGWAAVKPAAPGQAAGQSPLVERLPPDILMTALGRRAEHFRGGTGETYAWPQILPMWFHYTNPVSGRMPRHYWPDSVPGLDLPQSRLIANGYQMPPNGPEQDGIAVALTPPEAAIMEGEGR